MNFVSAKNMKRSFIQNHNVDIYSGDNHKADLIQSTLYHFGFLWYEEKSG